MSSEKRKGVRVRANLIANFQVKTIRLVGGSRVKDISEVGLCLPSKHHFEVNSILELEIRSEELPETLKTTARVVRVNKINSSKYNFEIGLEFIDLLPGKRSILQKFIGNIVARGENADISWMD